MWVPYISERSVIPVYLEVATAFVMLCGVGNTSSWTSVIRFHILAQWEYLFLDERGILLKLVLGAMKIVDNETESAKFDFLGSLNFWRLRFSYNSDVGTN